MAAIIRSFGFFSLAVFVLILSSCGTYGPFGTSSQEAVSVALSVSLPYAPEPDWVLVNVSGDNFSREGESPFDNPDGIVFHNLPLGEACVTIEGKLNNIKLYEGANHVLLKNGSNSVMVLLNRILIAYGLMPDQAQLFDKTATTLTPFWNNITGLNSAQLSIGGSTTSIKVNAAIGDGALFILGEVIDENFISGQGEVGDFGEWQNDFLVLYLSLLSPFEEPNFFNTAFYRIQCKIGEDIPENGELQLKSFNSAANVDLINTIQNFGPIDAKIITDAPANKRTIEMRIPVSEVGLDQLYPNKKIACVIRYNDRNDQSQTFHLDWKQSHTNPNNTAECWGLLELQ